MTFFETEDEWEEDWFEKAVDQAEEKAEKDRDLREEMGYLDKTDEEWKKEKKRLKDEKEWQEYIQAKRAGFDV